MRKVADCRQMPSESNCTLTIAGEEDEVLRAAVQHAVSVHGHDDTDGLRQEIRSALADEGAGTERLRSGYDAFARGDVDEVLSRLTDDITWTEPATIPFGGTYRGPKAVAGMFGRLPQYFSRISIEPESYLEQGNRVVVTGRHRHQTLAGQQLDLPFVHVWTLRDLQATGFEEFVDTTALNAALGVGAEAKTSV